MDTAFLGVEHSLSGRRWRARLADDRAGLALAQRLDVPEIVGRVLAARGIDADGAEAFLNPTLRAQLPDPLHLLGMAAAVARLVDAVRGGETIAVFGDYDVDGATSAALLKRAFEAMGAKVLVHIPDRIIEGYGPNAPALLALQAQGAGVVVTVDCGTAAHAPLAAAAAAKLDVIVVDHHIAEPELPPALAVINPNRCDETSPHRQLAAVGVAFLLVVALNRALRQAGWFGDARAEPDLRRWLDLVALGTVCDVVPLTGVNRALVTAGLKVMARRGNVGLAALADVAALDAAPGAYHAGFVLGPRVNAGGRVGEAGLGARLLSTEDPAEAADIAARLDLHNSERRAIEALVLDAAIAAVEAGDAGTQGLLVIAGEGWHPGVIGIVAARLRQRYDRPALVIALADGVGKGSARSLPGVDIGAAVAAARQAGLLVNGGGHAMAAGLTVEAGRIAEMREFLAARVAVPAADAGRGLGLDGALDVAAATPDLVASLEAIAPFGAGNAEPRFAVVGARIVRADIVGKDHVRCILAGPSGGRLKTIAFGAAERPLGQGLLAAGGRPMHLAGHLRADNWQGRDEAQLIVDDAAAVPGPGA